MKETLNLIIKNYVDLMDSKGVLLSGHNSYSLNKLMGENNLIWRCKEVNE